MLTNTIWVVMAETGEYSDRDVWVQAAFAFEENAKLYCDTISAAAREHFQRDEDWKRRGMYGEAPRFEFGGVTCQRGARYSVEEVPLLVPHRAADGAVRHFCAETACPDLPKPN